jgi:hypothetical protein
MIITTKMTRYAIEHFNEHYWEQMFSEYETLSDAQEAFRNNVVDSGEWNMSRWRFVKLTKTVEREELS